MITLDGLGRIEETIKSLERLQGQVERISLKTGDGGLIMATVDFRGSMNTWRIPRMSERGSSLLCSFAKEKHLNFERQ